MNTEQIISTEHPYIVKIDGVCGGRPIIKGTRTPVQAIVEYYRLIPNSCGSHHEKIADIFDFRHNVFFDIDIILNPKHCKTSS